MDYFDSWLVIDYCNDWSTSQMASWYARFIFRVLVFDMYSCFMQAFVSVLYTWTVICLGNFLYQLTSALALGPHILQLFIHKHSILTLEPYSEASCVVDVTRACQYRPHASPIESTLVSCHLDPSLFSTLTCRSVPSILSYWTSMRLMLIRNVFIVMCWPSSSERPRHGDFFLLHPLPLY